MNPSLLSDISGIIDRFPGLLDYLSCDLYRWNDQFKKGGNPERLTQRFQDDLFVESVKGGLLVYPLISEEITLQNGQKIEAPLVWNARELVRYERLSNQTIPCKVHALAEAILQRTGFQEDSESCIEDFTQEDPSLNTLELNQMDALILMAVERMEEKKMEQAILRDRREQEIRGLEKEEANETKLAEQLVQIQDRQKARGERFSLAKHGYDEDQKILRRTMADQQEVNEKKEQACSRALIEKYQTKIEVEQKEQTLANVRQQIKNLRSSR